MSYRFDWWKDPSVVLREYGSIACQINDVGDIVLRQQDDYSEEDQTITVPCKDIERLAAALLAKAKESRANHEPAGQVPLPLPAPSKAVSHG
jgi:hypothetical protein